MATRAEGHVVGRKRLGRLPVNTHSTGREWSSNKAEARNTCGTAKQDDKHQKSVPMASKSSFSLSLCSEFDTEMVDIVEQMEKEQQGSGVSSCIPGRPVTRAKSQQSDGREGREFPQTRLEKQNTTVKQGKITPKSNTALNIRAAPSGKSNKRLSAGEEHNISWQSPQEASTPNLVYTQDLCKRPRVSDRTTPHVQTQLFKSLFTIPSPMCGLETSLSLGVDSQKENCRDNIRSSTSECCETPRTSHRGKRAESLCSRSDGPRKNKVLHQEKQKKNSAENTECNRDQRGSIQASYVPDSRTHVPDSRTRVPDTRTHVPDTRTHVPDTRTNVPDTRTHVPDTRTHVPDTRTHVPDTRTHVPDTRTHVPDTRTNVPDTRTHVPDTRTHVPDTRTHVPDTRTHDFVSCNTKSSDGPILVEDSQSPETKRSHSPKIQVTISKWPDNGQVMSGADHNQITSKGGSVTCDVFSNNKTSNTRPKSAAVRNNKKTSNGGAVSSDVNSNKKTNNGEGVSSDVNSNNKTSNGGALSSDINSNKKTSDANPRTSSTAEMTECDTETCTGGENRLVLANWGLPDTVLNQYHRRGITTMFDWQAECLCTENVLAGGNLVYSAPTSAGKTMVAELLVLKRIVETKKKAIIILPFVSVTREKMFYLQELYQDAGIRVNGFMGSHSPPGGLSSVDVAVCTIEKGNGLINRMLEENSLDQLGIIVVDELHLVGDPHRGYLLELLLTKICYVIRKEQARATVHQRGVAELLNNPIQIVGMSATLPNLDLLASWLNAKMFVTDFRPVPLTETIKLGTAIYNSSMSKLRDVDLSRTFKGDDDHVIPLCLETLTNGHSVLIFCPSKNWCEKLCESIAREFYNILKSDMAARNSTEFQALPLNKAALSDVVEQLRRTPVGLDSTLGRTVYYGVAYHHAGLTFDERDIVEGGFRQGVLKVLVATSTLSSGVNLPARRVIVRSPVVHAGKMIDFLTYKQMIGRAGRKGVDTEGESVLICKANEKSKAVSLVSSTLPPVRSCLLKDQGQQLSSSLKRAILEIVVSGVASCPKDVVTYISCTMLAASLPSDDQQATAIIQSCITFLQENEFVTLQKSTTTDGSEEERFRPSQLGSAVLASSMSPDEGLSVFAELQKARQCFVLENELHIIYLVTPVYTLDLGDKIDWYQFYCMWEKLSPDMKRVAELVGVREGFLARAVQGRLPTKTVAQARAVAVHRRFYTTLILHDLVHEVPLIEVARNYNCNKGQLQSLQQSAATFAGMVTVFCARLGWHNLELILSQFQHRLTFGVQRELCDLVRLTLLNGQRARVLFNAGFHTVASLASASPADVEAVLKSSSPFQSNKKLENETEWEAEQRRKSRCIWLTGRKGVTEEEAALAVIEEAKSVIEEELGGLGIQWRDNKGMESGENGVRSSVTDSELGDGGTQPANNSIDNSSNTSTRVQTDSRNLQSSFNMSRNSQSSFNTSRNSQSSFNTSDRCDGLIITGPGRGRRTRSRTKYRRSVNRSINRSSLKSIVKGSPIQTVLVSPLSSGQPKARDSQVIVRPRDHPLARDSQVIVSPRGHPLARDSQVIVSPRGHPLARDSQVIVSPRGHPQARDAQVIVSPPGKAVIRSLSTRISIQGHSKESVSDKVVAYSNSIGALTNNQVGQISTRSNVELRRTPPSVDLDGGLGSHVTVLQSEPRDSGQETIPVTDDKPTMGGSTNIHHFMITTSKNLISRQKQDLGKTFPGTIVVTADVHAGIPVSRCAESLSNVGTVKQPTSPIKFDQIIDDVSFTFDDSFRLSGLTEKEVKGHEKVDKTQIEGCDITNNEAVCSESSKLAGDGCDKSENSIGASPPAGRRLSSGKKEIKVQNTFYPGSLANNAATTSYSESAHNHYKDIQNTQNEFADSFELDTQTDFMMGNVSVRQACKNSSLTKKSVQKGDNSRSPPLYSEDLGGSEVLDGWKLDRRSEVCPRDIEGTHTEQTGEVVNIGHDSRQKGSIQGSNCIQNHVSDHRKTSVISFNQAPVTDRIQAPVIKGPVVNQIHVQAPVSQGPVVDQIQAPVIKGPVVDRIQAPVIDCTKGPVTNQIQAPVIHQIQAPVIQGPVVDRIQAPVIKGPVVDQINAPVIKGPVIDRIQAPVSQGPVTDQMQAPVIKGPVVDQDQAPVIDNSLHDVSMELIAASNFDDRQFGYSEEGEFELTGNEVCNSSYGDLHIVPPNVARTTSPVPGARKGDPPPDQLTQDFVLALEMSDSFSCTAALTVEVEQSAKNCILSEMDNCNPKHLKSGVTKSDPKVSGISGRDPKCRGFRVRNNELESKRTDTSNCVPHSVGPEVEIEDPKSENMHCDSNVVQITEQGNEMDSMDESLTISMLEKALDINLVESTEKDIVYPVTSKIHPVTSKIHPVTSKIHPVTSIMENNKPQLQTVVKPGTFLQPRLETAVVSSCKDKNTSVDRNKNNKALNGKLVKHQKKPQSITSGHKHLSPGTLNFLNNVCETASVSNRTNDRKPAGSVQSDQQSTAQDERRKCVQEKRSQKSKTFTNLNTNPLTNNQCLSSAAGLEDSVRITRSRKRRSTEKGEAGQSKKQVTVGSGEKEDSFQNLSTGSDCLPPTPPPVNCMSPHLSLRKVTPLKTTPRRGKGSQKLDMGVGTTKSNSSKDGDRHPVNPPDVVYKERFPPIDPNDSGIPCTPASFTIVDVCADRRLFDTFIKEWATKSHYALSVACETRPLLPLVGGGIGGKFGAPGSRDKLGAVDGLEVEGAELVVVGVSVCWENRDSYYMALTKQNSDCDLDDSLAPPPLDDSISMETRLSALQSVLEQGVCGEELVNIAMFDVKASYCVLVRSCGIAPRGRFQDPKVACWLMDPGAKEKNLHRMVTNYLPTEVPLLDGIGGGVGFGSLGMTPQNPGSGRFRATTEAVLTLHVMDYLRAGLHKEGLHQAFQRVEMPSIVTLARMQLNGFGFSEAECESQQSIMTAKLTALEEEAYQLAGHPFSLTSTEDVAQVLFIELQLPPTGDPSSKGQVQLPRKTTVTRRGGQKAQFSTSKDVLEKLRKLHDLPGVVLEWRRISNALTKVVFPLQKEKVQVAHLNMHRIFCECQVHTATGRVSMADPNLQNIPKDFEISLPDVIGESPPVNQAVLRQTGTKGKGGNSRRFTGRPRQAVSTGSSGESWAVSMRHAFVPFTGGVILAADYSQLELRMIAHLSGDAKLTSILNRDGDVFKMIAAQWKSVSVEHVTPKQRQQAKQVCYGMVYGIGPKALGEQLEVDENDAAVFIETFKSRYPGMRTFLRKAVETCRNKGYVETILGRRRYLPAITDTNPHARAHAERQAVNTTVQGSAADLVKKAMNRIDVRLSDVFPECSFTHRQRPKDRGTYGENSGNKAPSGGYLVLQLHDELIYEVARADVLKVAKIIKHEMEHAMTMSVRMPVKVKVGPSWGKLEDMEI